MKKYIVNFLLAFSIAFSQSVFSYDCVGKVTNVVTAPDGTITLSYGNIGWVYLCNVSVVRNGVPTEACKSMLSVLLAAKLADKNVDFWFNDTSNDCTNAAHPAWADLKNWYYGPAIL